VSGSSAVAIAAASMIEKVGAARILTGGVDNNYLRSKNQV
jgi:hypothetical protein